LQNVTPSCIERKVAYKKAQYFLYNVLQEELKNDARLMEWRLKNARR